MINQIEQNMHAEPRVQTLVQKSIRVSLYFIFLVVMILVVLLATAKIVDDVVSRADSDNIPEWKKVIAVYALRAGAGLGDKVKQTNLGYLYLRGKIAPFDEQKFLYWTTKAAAQGDHVAEFNLAVAYQDQYAGLSYDQTQVLYWLNRSAAGGYQKANELLTQLSAISITELAKSMVIPTVNSSDVNDDSSADVDFVKDLQDDPEI